MSPLKVPRNRLNKLLMDGRWCVLVCALSLVLGHSQRIGSCTKRSLINVILLDDDESPWSMKFVEGKVRQAVDRVNTDAAGKVIFIIAIARDV